MTERFAGRRQRVQDELPNEIESFCGASTFCDCKEFEWSMKHASKGRPLRPVVPAMRGVDLPGPGSVAGPSFCAVRVERNKPAPRRLGITCVTVSCEILERNEGRWKARQMVLTVIRAVACMAVNKGLCASALVASVF